MDTKRDDALCERIARSLKRCYADGDDSFVRGLFANDSLPAAGVCEDRPVDYEAFSHWLLGYERPDVTEDARFTSRSVLRISPSPQSEEVHLNVGGYRFTTSVATLEQCPDGSPLKELLALPGHPDGKCCQFFIDRDGSLFHHVLNFLRDGGASITALPSELVERRQLYREACYYRLRELALAIQSAYAGAPMPADEEARLNRLESLSIMHTDETDVAFDCLTEIVQSLLRVPIALISLVGDDHQWFKSRCGLLANQTPKNTSFCAFSFLPEKPTVLTVENAITDPRTCDNPLVIGEPYIGFYVGCPLVTSDGYRLGALCAIDHAPRKLAQWQYQVLVNFAYIAVQEIQRTELEKTRCKLDNPALEDFEPKPSNSTRAPVTYARREAWRSCGTAQVLPTVDYGSGPLRLSRMKEALGEVVCLVQVTASKMGWPILYANKTWTQLTDLQIRPPGIASALDEVGPSDGFLEWPCLWDFLVRDPGMQEVHFLRNLREAWELHAEPHEFGLMANLITVPPDQNRSGCEEVALRVSCRFVPARHSLDVAAAAVSAVPEVETLTAPRYPKGDAPESYLYYVLMAPTTDSPQADGESEEQAGCAAPATDGEESSIVGPTGVSSTGHSIGNKASTALRLKPTRPPFADVRLAKKVGQGSFGKVFYGHWLGSPVAVKIVEWTGKGTAIEPYFEAELSCTLSHPNLVQTFKYSTREKPERDEEGRSSSKKCNGNDGVPDEKATYHTWIVQEWCDAGTLVTLCDRPRADAKGQIEVLQICSDVASGGAYLHSRGIIHGDLTANNVLCKTQMSNKGYVCKICDFGLARILEGESTSVVTEQMGTVTHMAPELFGADAQLELTTKADVYAAGVLLWQALCGRSPWAGLPARKVIVMMSQGKRLSLPQDAPGCIAEIFAACTADDPEHRPTMDELAESLGCALECLDDAGEASSDPG